MAFVDVILTLSLSSLKPILQAGIYNLGNIIALGVRIRARAAFAG
jgi:hypothetical protein